MKLPGYPPHPPRDGLCRESEMWMPSKPATAAAARGAETLPAAVNHKPSAGKAPAETFPAVLIASPSDASLPCEAPALKSWPRGKSAVAFLLSPAHQHGSLGFQAVAILHGAGTGGGNGERCSPASAAMIRGNGRPPGLQSIVQLQ